MMNKTFFATALCLASYTAAIQLETESETSTAQDAPGFFAKAGIICAGCTDTQLDAVEGLTNSVYPYGITVNPFNSGDINVSWFNAHSTEFIAMVPRTSIYLQDQSLCTLNSPPVDNLWGTDITTACTVDSLVATIANTQSKMTAPITSLMTFNEPWDGNFPVSAVDAVEMWRNVLQPAAAQAGLKMISPTTKKSKKANGWTADFIAGCWAKRADADAPCDVNSISTFAIHDYHCAEKYWQTNYNAIDGTFYTRLIASIEAQVPSSDEMDWSSFVYNTPLWVTENSCSGDNAPQEATGYCERLTGQAGSTYGAGSVNWFTTASNIERWAWYIGYTTKTKGANQSVRMMNEDGVLLPPGRAIMSQNDPTTDCSADPIA